MQEYYLAIDIGASGGRHILGHLENGKMVLQEIYRFSNGMLEKDGHLVWDVDGLFEEIIRGMQECKSQGMIPVSVGIDTWAVDFCLLDRNGNRLGDAVAYRDGRTEGMAEEVYKVISEPELYARSGIQKQPFNTIYQLMALRQRSPELLAQAEKLLLIPDYFHYRLTGKQVAEYTNATTTQLVNPDTKDWDWELIDRLQYPGHLFPQIVLPGTKLGQLRDEIAQRVGYQCKVVEPATHDTASAVLAVPGQEELPFYISSGTWSLMGTELQMANSKEICRIHNMTNEGGYNYRYRFLKNIMGLWMIQSVRKELAPEKSYAEICRQAAACEISSLVDCNAGRFLAPENMTLEIQQACREQQMQVPEGIGEVAAVIYNSLAQCYGETIKELEELTGRKAEQLHIVGGGSSADYLNQLTAQAVGIPVLAGPMEATAIGNVCAQMIAAGRLLNLQQARKCVRESFPMKEFRP